MPKRKESLERALEDAVSRALRDNLAPLQRTADDLHQAYADLVAACSSSRPSNALPAMLRAQTAASALAAGLSVLSNFVAVALHPGERGGSDGGNRATASALVELGEESLVPADSLAEDVEFESECAQETPNVPTAEPIPTVLFEQSVAAEPEPPSVEAAAQGSVVAEKPAEAAVQEVAAVETQALDIGGLSPEIQDLHRRANRAAKVTMQDIKLLRPNDVGLGREHKDICQRLRIDLDRARKEYDRRFRAILDHPVDYFHRWMVEILAEGDSDALGEYPYPSPVLRH